MKNAELNDSVLQSINNNILQSFFWQLEIDEKTTSDSIRDEFMRRFDSDDCPGRGSLRDRPVSV